MGIHPRSTTIASPLLMTSGVRTWFPSTSSERPRPYSTTSRGASYVPDTSTRRYLTASGPTVPPGGSSRAIGTGLVWRPRSSAATNSFRCWSRESCQKPSRTKTPAITTTRSSSRSEPRPGRRTRDIRPGSIVWNFDAKDGREGERLGGAGPRARFGGRFRYPSRAMRGMERLLELQEIDRDIARLTSRRRALESGEELTVARAEADVAETSFGELRLALDALGREQQRLEHAIESLEAKIAAEDKRLYDGSVANAKELESLHHEVENLKARRFEREDELLVVLEQRESLEAQAKQREAVANDMRDRADAVISEAAAELVDVKQELQRKESEREAMIPQFDPEVLELYEDLRAQKKGIGATRLVDGVCQACHEQLSAMELDKLKRTDGVMRC